MKLVMIMLLSVTASTSAQALSLRVELNHLRSMVGSIRYILFEDKKGFPDKEDKSVRKGSVSLQDQTSFTLEGLKEGNYALSVIHDENDNQKLDTNILGIPTEGFGFSNNPSVFFGPPSFKRSTFYLSQNQTIKIKMKYLK